MRLRTANRHRVKRLRRVAHARSFVTWQRMVERATTTMSESAWEKLRFSGFVRRQIRKAP